MVERQPPSGPEDSRVQNFNNLEKAYDAEARRVILVDTSGNFIKATRSRENLAGSAGSGNNGDPDRVYTLTTSSSVDIVEVYIDGVLLVETTKYTIDNSAKTVTMVNQPVMDVQTITIFYNV
jgi:hypothetical protein